MDFEAYRNRKNFHAKKANPAAWAEYQAEEARLFALFKEDALREAGLEGHPKADAIFAKAWDHGHASGHSEVFNALLDLAELFTSDPKPKPVPNVTAGQGRALVGYRLEEPITVYANGASKQVAGSIVFFFADGASMRVAAHGTGTGTPYLHVTEKEPG